MATSTCRDLLLRIPGGTRARQPDIWAHTDRNGSVPSGEDIDGQSVMARVLIQAAFERVRIDAPPCGKLRGAFRRCLYDGSPATARNTCPNPRMPA